MMTVTFFKSEASVERGDTGPEEHKVQCPDFVQFTYELLRLGPEGDFYAFLNKDQDWELGGADCPPEVIGWKFSDVVVRCSE